LLFRCGAFVIGAITFLAQSVGQACAFPVLGIDNLINIPAKTSDMFFVCQDVIISCIPPYEELSQPIASVELIQALSGVSSESYTRRRMWTDYNGYLGETLYFSVHDFGWHFTVKGQQIYEGSHVAGLRTSSVFPLWDDIKTIIVSPFETDALQKDVGSKTSNFDILSGVPLSFCVIGGEGGRDKGKEEHNGRRVIQAMLFYDVSIFFIGHGLYLGTSVAAQRGSRWFIVGCLIALMGWFSIVFQNELVAFAGLSP
jgi:hypothetical protein